ncbi:nose resistant to fluoxetine protein 6 [Drosophila rhopaloa]|uniref:Nose resistant to fluoxetine protein 6 n=1 Tax=Drosophila rhopaloa TaxID=1041015 RepID=A0A6P4EEJ0_DRORH|nr:nose resistant to fluoxetine protein 6 [Drosophila rhopaloa]
MIGATGTLLIIWLAVANGVLPTHDVLLKEAEISSLGDYERLMELRSLGMEFFRQFQNISATELHLLDERLNEQDLVCLADMAQFMSGLTSVKKWAIKMIDSWGTIPSGLLFGNRFDLGNYEECLRLDGTISESHHIRGKYCLMELPIAKWFGYNSELLEMANLNIAVCFPSSCSAKNMETFLKQMLQRLLGVSSPTNLFFINEEKCKTNESKPLDGLTIFTIVLLSVFCATVIICTLYDYFLCPQQDKLPRLVKAFSARATSRSLFTVVDIKASPNAIHCLNGMRCLSLVWVILGHEYILNLKMASINQSDNIRWMSQPFTSFILYAPFAVDSFFFISGLLLVAIGLRALDKTKGKLNVPLMYLHRYLRLTPIVAVAILVYTKMLPLLAEGPISETSNFFDYSVCANTWYLTLLYVQNYATDDRCLPHTWYLAVDMQLYILSPILLIVLYKWGKKAAAGILLVMLLLSACLFATIMTNDFGILAKNGGQMPEVQRKIYFATHTHAAPWLIGALFGYVMHLIRGKQLRLNRIAVWAGWLLCLAMIFTSIFAMYPYAKLRGPSPTILEGALFYTLTRIGWPLALCWVVFACVQDYGGLANSFLSSPLWQPLAKLSYSAYIWHIFIMEVNHRRVRTNSYFSDYNALLNFWSCFGFTILMSFVLYVIIEAPLEGLEKIMFPRRGNSPTPSAGKDQAKPESPAEIDDRHKDESEKQCEAPSSDSDQKCAAKKSVVDLES